MPKEGPSLAAARSFGLAILLTICVNLPLFASEVRDYELTIAKGEINLTGSAAPAMTINGGIPGPTLRFTEGDTARIHVHNQMEVETSIHWHGLLVPPDMDGVPYLTYPPIAPGSSFTYEIPIRHSGTYWYHSHTSLQEQSGLYGSIVISPPGGEAEAADRDHVVLLSDWTDTDPYKVLRTLRRGSEWYAIERGTAQSIVGAARLGKLRDYFTRELQRMPAMDIADIAYDRFLANGRPESQLPAGPGETVRLRLINGGATTYFHVEFAGGPMTMVSADGIDVEPFEIRRLLISVAETYDVLVQIPEGGAFELRATAHDASGFTSVWLGDGQRHPAPTVPFPNLYETMGDLSADRVFALTPAAAIGMPDAQVEAGAFDEPGMNMAGHDGMSSGTMGHGDGGHEGRPSDPGDASSDPGHDGGPGDMEHGNSHDAMAHGGAGDMGTEQGAGHDSMERGVVASADRSARGYGPRFGWLATDLASRSNLATDGMGEERPWPPYAQLRARKSTALDAEKPVREVRLTLDGDMERYVWLLNNQPLSETDSIRIREGEVVRFIMINRTMMHHPMHLHGHFFRVVNGQGDYAPLKHTVNVEPMSTSVIEFDANEVGDWFFHCHLLYHMKAGMARVISYENFRPSPEVRAVRSNLYADPWYSWGEAELMSHMSNGALVTADTRNILAATWEIGWQDVDETEGEVVVSWGRWVNRYTTWFVGAVAEGTADDVEDPRAVLGVRYLLPFNIESSLWIDSDGEARGSLDTISELTPRLALMLEAEYDTLSDWEGQARLSYTLNQRFDLLAHWHSEFGVGGGLTVRF